MIKVDKLNPFGRMCVSLGMIPSSYKESLTYEEQILWFMNYLEKTVTPALNNNADAIIELQGLYEQIKTYVDEYFDNLNVQEEINNKLDNMAESGKLTEIIAQYLQLAGVLAYNTVAEMKTAENLVDGSVCKTLGSSNYLDGNGAYYKIRTVLNTDTIDEVNIIALNNFNSLIAELIPYSKIKPLFIDTEQKINNLERNAIYLGNSYTVGIGSSDDSTGIFKLTKNIFHNAYKFTGSGTGFLPYTDHENDTFIKLLERAIEDDTIDKNTITDIIIIGAYGDPAALHENPASFPSNITNACNSLVTLANTNYPNLKRIAYVYAEGRAVQNPTMSYSSTLSEEFDIHNLFKFILPRNNIEYLGWIGFNITLNSNYFSNDLKHPNDLGYALLSSYFKSAYNGNLTYRPIVKNETNLDCGIISGAKINLKAVIEPDKYFISFIGGTIPPGTTSPFNTRDVIVDFSSLNWCIPIAFGNKNVFGNDFTIQTTKANENTYNVNNQYIGKLELDKTNDSLSTKLICTTFSSTRTISANIGNAIISPTLYYGTLDY